MKTDKELYRIFEVAPEWVFELAGLPSPGKSTLRSVTVKALERRADGVIVPEAPDQPLTIVEFQFQTDDTIYRRTVVEMAAVQDAFPGRVVQGVIFFGYNKLDPQTVPWTQVVRSYVLPDVLQAMGAKTAETPPGGGIQAASGRKRGGAPAASGRVFPGHQAQFIERSLQTDPGRGICQLAGATI